MGRRPVVSRHVKSVRYILSKGFDIKIVYLHPSESIHEYCDKKGYEGYAIEVEEAKKRLFGIPVEEFVEIATLLPEDLYSNRRINHEYINATCEYYYIQKWLNKSEYLYEIIPAQRNIKKYISDNYNSNDILNIEKRKGRFYITYEKFLEYATLLDETTRRPQKGFYKTTEI